MDIKNKYTVYRKYYDGKNYFKIFIKIIIREVLGGVWLQLLLMMSVLCLV